MAQLRPVVRIGGRRVAAVTLLRSLLATTALVVVYYALPLEGRFNSPAVGSLLIGLVGFAVVIGYGVRGIVNSANPLAMAVQVLAIVFPLFIIIFATVYFVTSKYHPGTFSSRLTRTDSLYFTLTVFTTVGFGDITAVSENARVLVMIQMILDLAFLGAGLRLLTSAVRMGFERMEGDEPGLLRATDGIPEARGDPRRVEPDPDP